MAGYEIKYNDVRLIGILTRECRQSITYDDSNTDMVCSKVEIAGSTTINTSVLLAQNQHIGALAIPGISLQARPVEICKKLRNILAEPRKPFQYIQDGVVLHESDETLDCNNGPRVRFDIEPMGRNAIRITFHAEIARVYCIEGQPPAVLNNRWVVVDDVDDQWRTTRVWRGKLRVSNAANNVHAFRHLVVPRLSDGFQRKRMHFEGSLNALELSYEIVDQQLLGDAPPGPAVRMSGTHTESLSQDGATSIGQVQVRLDGGPGTDKLDLLQRCMQIINQKVQATKFQSESNWRWLELNLTDHFGNEVCGVDATAKVQRSIDPRKESSYSLRLGNMLLDTFARPLDLGGDYVRYRTIPPGLYPCTTMGLFACHLQSPCVNDHAMPQGSTIVSPGEETPGNEEVEQAVATYDPTGSSIDIDSPGYSQDQSEAMYTYARVNWAYDIDEGYVAMPYGEALPESKDTVALIRLHPAVAKVTAVIAVERIGDFPRLPKRKRFKDKNGIEYVPLKYRPTFQPPEYQGDGRKLHAADLTAIYSMSRAPEDGEYIVPPLPWDDQPETAVPAAVFQDKA